MKIYFGCFTIEYGRVMFETSPIPTNSCDNTVEIGKALKEYLGDGLNEYSVEFWTNTCENEHTLNFSQFRKEIRDEILVWIYKTLIENGCIYSDQLEDINGNNKIDDKIISNYEKQYGR